MPTSIKEALAGITPRELARQAGLSKSTAYFLCTGRTHFCSQETSRKILIGEGTFTEYKERP